MGKKLNALTYESVFKEKYTECSVFNTLKM